MRVCPQCGLPERKQILCDKWDCINLTNEPTAERRAQGPIGKTTERVLVRGTDGRIARVSAPRAIDTIGTMLRRGDITEEQAQAANRYRAIFRRAQLDSLKAADMARETMAYCVYRPNDATLRTYEARETINAITAYVGYPGSSALWHIVGLEESTNEWATEVARVTHKRAGGILIASLGSLQAYWTVATRDAKA